MLASGSLSPVKPRLRGPPQTGERLIKDAAACWRRRRAGRWQTSRRSKQWHSGHPNIAGSGTFADRRIQSTGEPCLSRDRVAMRKPAIPTVALTTADNAMAAEKALVRDAFEGLRKIVVPEGEEPAANVLRVSDVVFASAYYPRTLEMLDKEGYKVAVEYGRDGSRTLAVRVFRPRSSVSSTGHSRHILSRCSTRRSTIRRAADLNSSAWGILPK